MTISKSVGSKLLIGRNEWCQLPDLNIPAIKAKIDTGAKTSSLHAINIRPITRNNKLYVKFDVNPLQANTKVVLSCSAEVVDRRYIMSSNGHKENRFVIVTNLSIGRNQWPIEITLSNRDPLKFRMLLGREALNKRVLVDPSLANNQLKLSQQDLANYY